MDLSLFTPASSHSCVSSDECEDTKGNESVFSEFSEGAAIARVVRKGSAEEATREESPAALLTVKCKSWDSFASHSQGI